MASAGRILIMPKGNYDSSATYEMLDMVHYNGTSWLAKKTATGIEPSAANSEYWHNMFDIEIANNLTTTDEGKVLDARQGKILADALGGYKISTVNLSGNTDNQGFFVESNIPDTTDILSCKLVGRSGFCLPYNNSGGVWSFLVESWDRAPVVSEEVWIKVICATES